MARPPQVGHTSPKVNRNLPTKVTLRPVAMGDCFRSKNFVEGSVILEFGTNFHSRFGVALDRELPRGGVPVQLFLDCARHGT